MIIAGYILSCIVWWFVGGSIFLAAPAFLHSDANLGISYAKRDGKNTFWLQLTRIGICLVYLIFPLGFFVLHRIWF